MSKIVIQNCTSLITRFLWIAVDLRRNLVYNSTIELNQGNKKPSPPWISPFCGPIADILLADTYIIAASETFVKVKFLILHSPLKWCGGEVLLGLSLYENVAIATFAHEVSNAFQLVAPFQKFADFRRVKSMDFCRSLTPFLGGLCNPHSKLQRGGKSTKLG